MPTSKNLVYLTGRLIEKPAIKLKLNRRTSLAILTLASSIDTKIAPIDYIPVHFYGELAHLLSKKNLCEGDEISIQGVIRAYEVEDAKGGISTEIVINGREFNILNKIS